MDSEGYIDIAGHPTWVIRRGGGVAPILLLHGGLGDSGEMLGPLQAGLLPQHGLVAFDRRGHGRTRDTGAPFHFDAMADETIAVIEQLGLAPVHIVGWSDGGIIGLLLALRRPDLLGKLVTVGANYHYSGTPPSLFAAMDQYLPVMQAHFATLSPDGGDRFPDIATRVMHMWATEPTLTTDDLKRITTPVLVMAGDRDLLPLAHTGAMFEALPNSQLAIVPGTSHGVIGEKPDLAVRLILDFLAG